MGSEFSFVLIFMILMCRARYLIVHLAGFGGSVANNQK